MVDYGLRINDTPNRRPVIIYRPLCVTQQIQPKLAVTPAQYRERFLHDLMVGGYSSLMTSVPNFRQISESIGHPSPRALPGGIPAIGPSCIRYTSAEQQARWFET
jgi:hypothetical protein